MQFLFNFGNKVYYIYDLFMRKIGHKWILFNESSGEGISIHFFSLQFNIIIILLV